MAVVLDVLGTLQSGAGLTSADVPITISAGANLAVVLAWVGSANTTGIAATMAGGSETLAIISGTDGGGTTATVLLGKATTLTGAQTVHITWTTSQSFQAQVMSFTGVHQTTPFNGGSFTNGASPKSIIITSVSGDLTTTTVSTFVDPANLSTNQTQEWNAKVPSSTMWGGGDLGPGTGTTTHTWTADSGLFLSGANIVQAVAALAVDTAFASPIFRSRMREW